MYSGKFPRSLRIRNVLELIVSMILFIRTQGNMVPVYFTPVRFSPKNYAGGVGHT